MINIKIYSRKQIEECGINDKNIDQHPLDYFLCINATGHLDSIPYFKKNNLKVLNLYFDDTDVDRIKIDDDLNIEYPAIACKKHQAEQIKKFIKSLPEKSNLHIYCTKGKSRSTAVAKFAHEFKNKKKSEIEVYNHHVYNLLCSI